MSFETFIDIWESGQYQFLALYSNGAVAMMVNNQVIIDQKFYDDQAGQNHVYSKNVTYVNGSRIQLQGVYYCTEPFKPELEILWRRPGSDGFE